jgi:hypothetical protein
VSDGPFKSTMFPLDKITTAFDIAAMANAAYRELHLPVTGDVGESLKRMKAWVHWRKVEFENFPEQRFANPEVLEHEKFFVSEIENLIQLSESNLQRILAQGVRVKYAVTREYEHGGSCESGVWREENNANFENRTAKRQGQFTGIVINIEELKKGE